MARTQPDTQQSFYRDLLAVLFVFPLPRAPWPQPAALPHARTAGRSCGPRVVFPGIICTSLLFICVLQAPCASRPLVYTGNHHKSLPKGAASRQTPAASRPQQERACGYQPDPHGSRCKGMSHPAHPRAQAGSPLQGGTQGCCRDGSLPSWDAAHPSDPSGEEQGTTLGSKLRQRRCLPLRVSSLGETPKIIFGLA